LSPPLFGVGRRPCISRPDDGGTEGPERGAGGAKRRSAKEGRRSPSPVWGSGGYAPGKFFKKSTLKLHIFQAFLQAKNKMVSSAVSSRHVRLGTPF